MKNSRLLAMFLAVIAVAGVTPSSFAGSERWIMTMTTDRMVRENLVHVRFMGPDGAPLESNALKIADVREQDCAAGHAFQMIKDYKMGFSPEKKLVGLYLFPHAWQGKNLCFSIPGVGKAEKSFTADNNGQSIELKVMP